MHEVKFHEFYISVGKRNDRGGGFDRGRGGRGGFRGGRSGGDHRNYVEDFERRGGGRGGFTGTSPTRRRYCIVSHHG